MLLYLQEFMTKEQKECIEGYIQRCIPDIARKCGVKNDEVILVMSTFIPCELKATCETNQQFTMFTLEDLEAFVKQNNLSHLPFDEVMNLYKKEMETIIEEMEADAYLATMEAHELT